MGNELALVFFSSFVDLGCGLFIAMTINEWFGISEKIKVKGAILSLIILAIGGFSSVLHLGHPERIFGALGHPTSGIFLESSGIGVTAVCILIYIYLLKQKSSTNAKKAVTLVGAVIAAILAFAVGDSYVMAARPAWDTLTIPFVYLASALLMGSLCYFALLGSDNMQRLAAMKKWILLFVSVQAVAILAYLIALGSADYPDASRSVGIVLKGELAPLFWIAIVAIGLGVPAYAAIKNQNLPQNVAVAGGTSQSINFIFAIGLVCAFIGALAYRVVMFNLGTPVWQFF